MRRPGELSAEWTSITDNFPGRGFHGLRSRSLWWADTRSLYGRPSYLAFVNNLYFSNDVLHPSAAYQGIALFRVHTHVTKVCFQLASHVAGDELACRLTRRTRVKRTILIDVNWVKFRSRGVAVEIIVNNFHVRHNLKLRHYHTMPVKMFIEIKHSSSGFIVLTL